MNTPETNAVSTVVTDDNKRFLAFTTFYEKIDDENVDGYMAQLFQAMIHEGIVKDPDSYMITCNIFPSEGGIHFSVCMRDTTINVFKESNDVMKFSRQILNNREDKCHMFKFDLTKELAETPYWYHGHQELDEQMTMVINKMKESFKEIKKTVAYLSFGGSKTSKQNP